MKRAQGTVGEILLGAISTQPGLTLQDEFSKPTPEAHTVPVALSGRVPVRVSGENGSITAGTRIAPSPTRAGYGMKAHFGDPTIGFALGDFAPASPHETGDVIVFLNLDVTGTPARGDIADIPSQAFEAIMGNDMTTTTRDMGAYNPLSKFLSALFAELTAWLAGATNGIANIVSDTFSGRLFKGDRAEVKELCVGSICVTESQFAAVFRAAANDNPPTSVPSSPSNISEVEPPISVSSTTPDLTEIGQSDNANSTTTSPELVPQPSEEPEPANDNSSPSDDAAYDNPAPPDHAG